MRDELTGRIDRLEERVDHVEERLSLKIDAASSSLRAGFEQALRENTRVLMLAMVTCIGFAAVVSNLTR